MKQAKFYLQQFVVDDITHQFIVRADDWAQIPFDDSNRDYQQYLAWLAEGNTPEPWNSEPAPIDEA